MLETLFNSRAKELILLYIYTYQEGYANEICRSLALPLRSVQLQLKRLEEGQVLVGRKHDRTWIYKLNPRYPFYNELVNLLERLLSLLPHDDVKKFFTPRLRPRRINKLL